MTQFVRVVSSPPEVYEPGAHRVQFGAAASLYMLSAPHTSQSPAPAPDHLPGRHDMHVDEPASAYLPAMQRVWLDEPSHSQPSGQTLQVFPSVKVPAGHPLHVSRPLWNWKRPAGQSTQLDWPVAFWYLPTAHKLQSSCPPCPSWYLPASQG